MSCARSWATRARAPPKRRAGTPLVARSWLTRLSSMPAAPPMVETGGAAGLGGGGAGRGGAGAGRAAAGAETAAGAGVATGGGGASSTSLARSLVPACRARRKATLMAVGRVATTECARLDPTMAPAAMVSIGMLTISVARGTERDKSNPPGDLSRVRWILGRRDAPDQAVRRPRNHPPGLSSRWHSGYQPEAATKKRSWPSNWPGRMALIAGYRSPVVDMNDRSRQVASARPAATSGRTTEPSTHSTESTGLSPSA